MNHSNDVDHEVWMRCFTASIAGVFPARESQARPDPSALVKWCGDIADAALLEEQRRRRVTEVRTFGV
jgi:hypothetical protein